MLTKQTERRKSRRTLKRGLFWLNEDLAEILFYADYLKICKV